jgi:hypothetical protein
MTRFQDLLRNLTPGRIYMKRILSCILTCAAWMPAAISGLCNTGFETGCSGSTIGAVDDGYKVVSGPLGIMGDVYIVNSYPGWLPNTALSSWISPIPNSVGTDAPAGTYLYRFHYYSNVGDVISGRWSSDNSGKLMYGSTVISTTGGASFGSWTPFSFTSVYDGTDTLMFEVFNSGINPTGLRVEFDAVPEPVSMTLSGVGLVLVGLVRRWRKAPESGKEPART